MLCVDPTSDWREAAEREKFADCVIIATPDREHKVCHGNEDQNNNCSKLI